jgi:AbrB family looped-hinge helix DNA binding protein
MEAAMESAITVKGQTTIPKPIREHLGLKPGDRVKFFIHPDGTVVLLPKVSVTALRGMLRQQGPAVTIERMDDAIADNALEGSSRRRARSRR